MANNVFQLRVTLRDATPAIWRRILVPGDTNLRYLHYFLQGAMGWQDCHLYEYVASHERYGEIDDDAPENLKPASAMTLERILRKPGNHIEYIYDFGDGWTHAIELEAILPAATVANTPMCIDGARACPPEDFGGAFAYTLWLRKMAEGDLSQGALDALEEYPGFDFDPEKFSAAIATRRMKRVATNKRFRTWD